MKRQAVNYFICIWLGFILQINTITGQNYINLNLQFTKDNQLDSINNYRRELFKNITYNINLKFFTQYNLNLTRSRWMNYKINYARNIIKDYNKIEINDNFNELNSLFEKINYFEVYRDTSYFSNIFKNDLQYYRVDYRSNNYLDMESNQEYSIITDGGYYKPISDTIYFACLDKNTIRYLSGNLFLSSLKSLIKDSITAMILESSSSEKYKYEIDVYKSIFKQLLDVRKINYESLESKKGVLFIKLRNRKIKLSSKNYFYFCNLLIDGSNLSLFY